MSRYTLETPFDLEWRVELDGEEPSVIIRAGILKTICTNKGSTSVPSVDRKIFEEICCRVNCHDDLLAAAEAVIWDYDNNCDIRFLDESLIKLKAAIAKAEK